MHELPLLIFTCGLELSVGLLAFAVVASFIDKESDYKTAACASCVLGIAAVIGSLAHLGVPTRAVYAIDQFGTSPLSNEIVFAGAFVACSLAYAILCLLPKANAAAKKTVALIGAVVGIVALVMVGNAYSASEVPLWDGASAYVEPVATALSCGAAIFLALYSKSASKTVVRIAGIVAIGAVAVQAAFAVPEYAGLALGSGAATASAEILASSSAVVTFGWVLVGVGAAWAAWQAAASDASRPAWSVWGAAGVLTVGQVVVRYFFYAAMVTTAVGLL
jgi:anaerobic dimethyl sulfoxide reductase subunit C (anchor subunit)